MTFKHIVLLIMVLFLVFFAGILLVPVPDHLIRDFVHNNNHFILRMISGIRPDTVPEIFDNAFRYDNPEIVQMLLDNGVDSNYGEKTKSGDIPIFRIAVEKRAYKCVQVLLDNGASIYKNTYYVLYQLSFCHFRSQRRKDDFDSCISKLTDHGININACSSYAYKEVKLRPVGSMVRVTASGKMEILIYGTILHGYFSSSDFRHYAFVYEVYKKNGFDPRIKDTQGKTIRDIIEKKVRKSSFLKPLLRSIEEDMKDLDDRNIPVVKTPYVR